MRLRVSLVRIPLLSPFANSVGTTVARTALILRLEQRGTEALSECVADEAVSPTGEDNDTALALIERFVRRLERPPSPGEFLEGVRDVKGNQMAKAAVEMLLWDYAAKEDGMPLDEALGASRGYAEAGVAIGLQRQGLAASLEAAVERGYRRVKVKISREGALETLRAAREAFPELRLSADANACFELPRDLSILRKIDGFGLEYLEQPLPSDDLRGHARLARQLSTPICLDESVTSLESAEEALDMGAAEVINVKPGRVGGLTVAVEVAKLARAKGAHVWVGGMLETGVGRAFNVALASQREVDYPGDTSPNDRYFERDIVRNPFVMRDGRVRPNRGGGVGVELDTEFLAEVTLKSRDVL